MRKNKEMQIDNLKHYATTTFIWSTCQKNTPKATATIRIDELLLTKPNQLKNQEKNFYSFIKHEETRGSPQIHNQEG